MNKCGLSGNCKSINTFSISLSSSQLSLSCCRLRIIDTNCCFNSELLIFLIKSVVSIGKKRKKEKNKNLFIESF